MKQRFIGVATRPSVIAVWIVYMVGQTFASAPARSADAPANAPATGPADASPRLPPAASSPATGLPTAPAMVQPDPTAAPIRLTLDDALKIALGQNPSTEALADRIERARARVREVGAAVAPQVNGIATFTEQGPISSFTIGGGPGMPARAVKLGTPTSKTIVFGARQPLDLSGQNRISRDIARRGITGAELDLARAENDLLSTVINDYYAVLRSDEFVRVQREAVADAEEQRRVAQARFAAGDAAQFDVTRAAVQVVNLQQQFVTARKNASAARAQLLNAIGLDPDTQIDAAPVTLPPAPVTPAGAVVGAGAANPAGTTPAAPEPPASTAAPDVPGLDVPVKLEDALRIAYVERPEIRGAANAVRTAERGVDLARRGLRPDVALNGQYLITPDVAGFSSNKQSWSVNAQLTWPLFDGGATRARVNEARSDVRAARATLKQMQQAVGLDVRSALLDVQDAAARRETAAANVGQAREAVRIARVRFQAGVSTTVEVTDAEVALTQAQTNAVNADYDFLSAAARLRRATGRLVPPGTRAAADERPGPAPTLEQALTPRHGEGAIHPATLNSKENPL